LPLPLGAVVAAGALVGGTAVGAGAFVGGTAVGAGALVGGTAVGAAPAHPTTPAMMVKIAINGMNRFTSPPLRM